MDIEKTLAHLNAHEFEARYFATSAEAADYVVSELHGQTIGIGGSKTVEALGLYDRLIADNTVAWHWKTPDDIPGTRRLANASDVYLCSANGIAETGELVNIDGSGNRLAGMMDDKRRVIVLAGVNKIAPTLEQAIWRARNIAAPLNARRFGRHTPCGSGELRCYDCSHPSRLCKAMLILPRKPNGVDRFEVILIGEELGY
ncbi:MAG: lactate utilization protein [Eubacteriales bacterium]|nr:lactate utilization protein [Eubacteriales bacterium]